MVDHLDDILASATQQVNAGALGPDVTATFHGAAAFTRTAEGTRRRLVTGGDPDAPAPLPRLSAFVAPSGADMDYCKGPDIERIADALIEHCSELSFLQNVIIRYLWRRKKQVKNGKITLGTCAALTGVPQFALGGGEFIITLNWQNCRDAELKAWQLEALIYHELNHIAPPDEEQLNAAPTVIGHDVEMFHAEVERYGLWTAALERADQTFGQYRLDGF